MAVLSPLRQNSYRRSRFFFVIDETPGSVIITTSADMQLRRNAQWGVAVGGPTEKNNTRVLSTNLELYMSERNYPDRKTNQRSNLMRTAISGYSQARESNLP